MRDIKFRVWNGEEMEDATLSFNFEDGQTKKEIHIYPEDIFMQYTGKSDKHDNEIYEGDIVDEKFKCEVFFENGSFWVRSKHVIPRLLSEFIELREKAKVQIEVIGNIYENKDLL